MATTVYASACSASCSASSDGATLLLDARADENRQLIQPVENPRGQWQGEEVAARR